MSFFTAFIAGLVCKAYDDFKDNNKLQQYRNEKMMEVFKGLHYISFTATSIEEPLFAIIYYLGNFLHSITNPTSFIEDYESILGYTFGFLLFILNYKKITNVSWLDKLVCIFYIGFMFIEPIISYETCKDLEYSFTKLFFRTFCIIIGLFYFIYVAVSPICKYIILYMLGYGIFSVLVQVYSLHTDMIQPQPIKDKNRVKNKKSKNKEPVSSRHIFPQITKKVDKKEKKLQKKIIPNK